MGPETELCRLYIYKMKNKIRLSINEQYEKCDKKKKLISNGVADKSVLLLLTSPSGEVIHRFYFFI